MTNNPKQLLHVGDIKPISPAVLEVLKKLKGSVRASIVETEEFLKLTDGAFLDFDTLQESIVVWGMETFPEATEASILDHLRKEVKTELGVAGGIEEYADVAILLMHAAGRFRGNSLRKAVEDKMVINREREWGPVNDKGFQEHVKITKVEMDHKCIYCETFLELTPTSDPWFSSGGLSGVHFRCVDKMHNTVDAMRNAKVQGEETLDQQIERRR